MVNITVIVPLYNKVSEIERAIKSILNQTLVPSEIIVIDGGSTDGSLDVLSPYLNNGNISLVHQQSKGLPAARNEAILLAKGNLIAFLDADDEWLPDFLKCISSLYSQYPDAGLYATSYYITNNGRTSPRKLSHLPKNYEGLVENYFKLAPEYPFCPCCVAIPKHTFETVGYFNPHSRMAEDIEMWTKIALKLPICYSTKPCALYHTDGSNQMTKAYYSINHHPVIDYVSSLDSDSLSEFAYFNDLMLFLDHCRLSWGYFNIGAGDMETARSFLKEIKSNQYHIKKYILYLISLIPFGFGKYLLIYLKIKIDNILSLIWDKQL